MRSKADKAANPGRRRFIKQAAGAGLLTAVASRFPVAYGESTQQRGLDMARTILMNGKFATLDPKRPRATAAHRTCRS